MYQVTVLQATVAHHETGTFRAVFPHKCKEVALALRPFKRPALAGQLAPAGGNVFAVSYIYTFQRRSCGLLAPVCRGTYPKRHPSAAETGEQRGLSFAFNSSPFVSFLSFFFPVPSSPLLSLPFIFSPLLPLCFFFTFFSGRFVLLWWGWLPAFACCDGCGFNSRLVRFFPLSFRVFTPFSFSCTNVTLEEKRIAPRPKLPIQVDRSALFFRDAQMQSCCFEAECDAVTTDCVPRALLSATRRPFGVLRNQFMPTCVCMRFPAVTTACHTCFPSPRNSHRQSGRQGPKSPWRAQEFSKIIPKLPDGKPSI